MERKTEKIMFKGKLIMTTLREKPELRVAVQNNAFSPFKPFQTSSKQENGY